MRLRPLHTLTQGTHVNRWTKGDGNGTRPYATLIARHGFIRPANPRRHHRHRLDGQNETDPRAKGLQLSVARNSTLGKPHEVVSLSERGNAKGKVCEWS